MQVESILVPVDFSKHSARAVAAAIEMARRFDAEIHLLHCHKVELGLARPFQAVLPGDYRSQVKRIARDMLEKQRSDVEDEGVPVHAHLRADLPAEGIAKAAERLGSDLIVMGTRGLGGLEHVLMGSVAEQTLRSAPCPVLVVRAD